MRYQLVSAGLLGIGLLAGCSHKSSTKNNSKSASSTSKNEGKVFTPDSKGGGAAGATSGSRGNAPLPSPADTTDYKPSASSDAGTVSATKGQPVMNPGAPVAHLPKKR